MSHSIQRLPNEPIIIATFIEPFDPANDTGAVADYLQDALKNSSGTLCYIADMTKIKIKFSELVVGLAQAFADKSSPYVNPRLKMFTAGSDELMSIGTKAAAEQEQYNKASVKIYGSVDEALKEARQALS